MLSTYYEPHDMLIASYTIPQLDLMTPLREGIIIPVLQIKKKRKLREDM